VFKKINASSGDSGDEKQSMALDNVAKEVLKLEFGKTEGIDGSMAWMLWSMGDADFQDMGPARRLLGRYCVNDTDLLRRMDAKTQFLSLLDAISQSCGTFPDNYGLKGVNFVESYLLRLGRQRGYHFPSNWRDKGSDPFAGAYVMEPTETGILRNVHVCDFAGLYPSVIQTWNMSLETHLPELKRGKVSTTGPSYLLAQNAAQDAPLPAGCCVVPLTGEVFQTSPSGILPDAVTAVREQRKYYDKLKASFPPGSFEFTNAERGAQGCKIFVNTFYGVAGSPFSRIFRRAIGESVTQASVWLIKNVIRVVSERAMRGVYGDTDSVFVTGTTESAFRALVAELNATIFPALLREQGCVRNEIRLEYEKEFEVLILVGKKRYAGRYRQYKGKPAQAGAKPEIKGLEYRRGDTAKICRDFQKRVIDTLLGGDVRLETYVELVKAERERVLKGELDRTEFVLSKRLSGSTDSYRTKKKKDGEDTSKPIHVQVAEQMKASGQDVSEGTRISYVVVDASDKLVAVPLSEYMPGSEDRFYLWENLVYPATQRVLEVCFKTHDWRQYEKARPPKPRRGRKVADEQMAFPEFGVGALESK
jgi:DNA polymerase elongation subunit (family B)